MANEEELKRENSGESIEFDNVSQDNDLDCLKEPEQPLGGMDEAVSGESGAESEPDMSVALAELKKANEELMDKYLRVQAEYQNYRKRVSKDIASARNYAVIDTLTPFLQLFDNFSMAVRAAGETTNIDALVQGLNMIQNQYTKAIEDLGVTNYSAVGEKFDPQLHDAIATEKSDTVPEGVVIREWCCGYRMGDNVLRPARVVVSGGAE